MEYKDIKFFIGPMSKNIVDTIIKIHNDHNINFGFIPTRRQIDHDSGYVNNWTTKSFIEYVRNNSNDIIIERDHGGAHQGTEQDNGNVSFIHDAENNFDIIHIDPWKYNNIFEDGIKSTINYIKMIYHANPHIMFEVSTEEAIYPFTVKQLDDLLMILKLELGDEIFRNIIYVSIQSGTRIEGTKNIGNFNIDKLNSMIKVCKKYGKLSKEHNGDYLTKNEYKIRFDNGLDAINIAPEFGVIESNIILDYLNDNNMIKEKEKMFNICYDSKKWVKWVNKDFNPLKQKDELIRICGHYIFSNEDFLKINLNIENFIKEKLYIEIKNKLIL